MATDRHFAKFGVERSRCLILGNAEGVWDGPSGNDRVLFQFDVKHESGALGDFLAALKLRNINLSSLHSFPVKRDLEHHTMLAEAICSKAEFHHEASVLKTLVPFFRVIGAFPDTEYTTPKIDGSRLLEECHVNA
eukprot:GHVN01020081.1.p1 GENE.GHVN01020081.1~~GHVN01020081.1.p1  ORF type:complete len:135 (+),score=13.12 GHVN01020081.1:889-1293(+)